MDPSSNPTDASDHDSPSRAPEPEMAMARATMMNRTVLDADSPAALRTPSPSSSSPDY